jgi:predicted phosphodiesterase
MRVFVVSDLHVDYEVNAKWIQELSKFDYRDDVLILAGDVSHRLAALASCISALVARFARVLFVPGNHDVWVLGDAQSKTSFDKFWEVTETVEASGASMRPFIKDGAIIVPLLGWYDYSFGEPSDSLREIWMDFHACRWPEGVGAEAVAAHFASLNDRLVPQAAARVITFSHFLPRLDLLPAFVPRKHRVLEPVLGSMLLERQLRQLNSRIHVYGHSHINRTIHIDGVMYVNNALGYPAESAFAAKRLLCIGEV